MRLELCGRNPAQSGMRADGIVEGFQIEEDAVASGGSGRIAFQVDEFTFQAAEEIFSNGVIIGIAST